MSKDVVTLLCENAMRAADAVLTRRHVTKAQRDARMDDLVLALRSECIEAAREVVAEAQKLGPEPSPMTLHLWGQLVGACAAEAGIRAVNSVFTDQQALTGAAGLTYRELVDAHMLVDTYAQ